MVVAVLTGHAPVRKHLRTMGLFVGDPACRFCGRDVETAQHIICCYEALARQRNNVFGSLVVEPTDIRTATVKDLCLFIRGTGLRNLSCINIYGRTIRIGLRCIPGQLRRLTLRKKKKKKKKKKKHLKCNKYKISAEKLHVRNDGQKKTGSVRNSEAVRVIIFIAK
jgi:hypothetical protein